MYSSVGLIRTSSLMLDSQVRSNTKTYVFQSLGNSCHDVALICNEKIHISSVIRWFRSIDGLWLLRKKRISSTMLSFVVF